MTSATETPALAGPAGVWPEATLLELFSARVRCGPDRVAVRYGDDVLTYGELELRSNRLANYLAPYGPAESLVAIFLERSLALFPALFGVLKAGLAYVPVDPNYPQDRVARMLRDGPVRVVLTDERGRARLAAVLPSVGSACTVISLDEREPAVARCSAERPPVSIGPRDLAYVLYTSGSTGAPKGVEIEHGALVNLLSSMRVAPGIDASDAMLALTTISFDMSTPELYLPLIAGAQIVLASSELAREGAQLVERLDEGDITLMQGTPSTWTMLLAAGWRGSPRLKILCGGEPLSRALADALLPRCASLWNIYGPTESTVWSSTARVRGGATAATPVLLGDPLHNTQLYVLDAALRPVPPGAAGELYIGGAGVARGYRNEPVLTAERFVADPFAAPPARLYRTGDVARRDAGGSIEYVGRADRQVKVRGFRVELGEIEAALHGHPGVAQAAVLLHDGASAKRLVAYVVVSGPTPPDARALRRALAERLPEYMVPAAFVLADAFALTPSGKIDRRALPEPPRPAGSFGAPRTPAEEMLCGVVSEVLSLDRVGTGDDFFALGGDSVRSIQIVSRARSAGWELTQRDVFSARTIRALAAAARRAAPRPGAPADAPPLQLSPAQRRSLAAGFAGPVEILPVAALLEALFEWPDPDGFAQQLALELTGALDGERLRSAADALLRRHAILRAAIRVTGLARPVHVIPPALRAPWRTVDLAALDAPARDARLEELLSADLAQRFVLAEGPLLRFALVRVDTERHVLVVTNHLALLDGWSLPLLFGELFALYTNGEAGALPPVRPYAQYLAWCGSRDRAAAHAIWRAYLAGLDAPARLTSSGPDHAPPVAAVWRTALTPELSADLRRVARERGLTLNSVVQGVWAALLGRVAGSDDVVFGVLVAGRPPELPGVERMIGMFMNVLPLRVRLNSDEPFSMLLARIQASQTRLAAAGDVSLHEIMRAFGGGAPIESVLVFQNYPREATAGIAGDLRITAVRGREARMQFPISVTVVPGERLQLQIEYDTTRFDRDRAEALGARFVALVEAAAAAPDAPLRLLESAGSTIHATPAEDDDMTNPFEDDDAEYRVLVNDEGQHSLWPALLDVPAGWTEVGPHAKRAVCLAWLEANWTDMRPKRG